MSTNVMANLEILFSDSSSDAEEIIQHRRKVYKVRREPFDDNYRQLYRFSRDAVVFLTNHFLPVDEVETRGGATTAIQKMHCFLRYASDPGFQVSIFVIFYTRLHLVTKNLSSISDWCW